MRRRVFEKIPKEFGIPKTVPKKIKEMFRISSPPPPTLRLKENTKEKGTLL